MADETKACVVCGAASHREDWINKQGNFVACDSHTPAKFQRAVTAVQAKGSTKPPASTAPPAGHGASAPTPSTSGGAQPPTTPVAQVAKTN
jgi:hypothetical protein